MTRNIEICRKCDKVLRFKSSGAMVCTMAESELLDIFLDFKNRKVPEQCVFFAEQMIANLNGNECCDNENMV